MALAMEPLLSSTSNLVLKALQNEAQFALDFKAQLEEMKTKLDPMKAFLSTYNLRNHGDFLRPVLCNMRNLIYEADDILTDCQLRDEYRKHGSSAFSRNFSPRGLKFMYETGKKLKNINERIKKMEASLQTYLVAEAKLDYKADNQGKRNISQEYYDPSEIIGLENDIEKIKGWMLSGNEELRHVGIVGMGDFHQLATKGDDTASVTSSLKLSYDELPAHLKSCLLCFSIFPEDFTIRAEQIVLWWVGEGLILGDERKTAIELGYEYLSQLASRCLIEVENRRGYDGMIYSCKMHDLVRDMTIDIAKDEAFGSFDEQCNQQLTEDSRWLGFTSDMDPKSLKNSSKLRALLLISSHSASPDSSLDYVSFDRTLKLLRPKRSTVLNRKLRNLRTLVLSECNNLAKLDPATTNLKELILLDVGFCCRLQYLPFGLEKLVNLQELSGFRIVDQANRQSCRLLELQSLKQLRVLGMNINEKSEISENECNVLTKLEKLKVLVIDADDCKDKSVFENLDRLSPPPSLKELYLKRYRHETLPKWINPKQLSSLLYLRLEHVDAVQLQMSTTSESEGISTSKWKLEGLRLKYMAYLQLDLKSLEQDLPSLNYVEVSFCYNLNNLPESDKLLPMIWRKNQGRLVRTQ
ncbi:hypothetical protein Patl1_09720 [Pistacia atlantica]|uniref:Uncharacterized protein n=1 Tax=Pistacia atlantica TaxID=434234 RepID=A0ACC1A5X0_9ROSI|nr:hypothetical protein Patl1_09720 [Pistacia atlantica]